MLATKNKLLIMRHAKSDKSDYSLDDFDRPLNKHGEKQPAKIARQLNELNLEIDLALVSPSLRTSQSFELLVEYLPNPPSPILDQRLYNAQVEEVLEVVQEYQSGSGHILVVGHNPSLSQLVSILTKQHHELGTADLAILCPKTTMLESLKTNSFSLEKILNS
jgi:phosphohistidine phosphatase